MSDDPRQGAYESQHRTPPAGHLDRRHSALGPPSPARYASETTAITRQYPTLVLSSSTSAGCSRLELTTNEWYATPSRDVPRPVLVLSRYMPRIAGGFCVTNRKHCATRIPVAVDAPDSRRGATERGSVTACDCDQEAACTASSLQDLRAASYRRHVVVPGENPSSGRAPTSNPSRRKHWVIL